MNWLEDYEYPNDHIYAIERQKDIVVEKQKEILDSIYYAEKIQKALITSEKYIEKTLERIHKT